MSGAPSLVDPADPAERRAEKLLRISEALMRRVELATDKADAGYAHFQRAVLLEEEVRERTRDLEGTLELLNQSNAQLEEASRAEARARADLANALEAVEEGFALFGPDKRLVLHNSRFCRQLPDVWETLAPGMSFGDYIERCSRSASLDLRRGGGGAAWVDRRRKHPAAEHAIFNVALTTGEHLQISEHRTPDGGIAILHTDVTDMVRLEHAERDRLLDAQARMIRATLDHMAQGVCIFDENARLVGWNRRADELLNPPNHFVRLGTRFRQLLEHIEQRADFAKGATCAGVRAWISGRGAREPMTFDLRFDDDTILSVFMAEMPDRGFLISFSDVTTERRAVAALAETNQALEERVHLRTRELEQAVAVAERANASKSRFVAAASHDLLQPLSAAKLFLSTLSGMELGAKEATIAHRAQNALGSVESILNALLDISRLDSGRAEVKRSAIDLGLLLSRLEEEHQPLAREKGLSLRVVPTAAVVDSDPSLLRRILQNLLANAIRYTEAGRVLIGVRRAGDAVRVEVVDTGPGIPAESRDEIFREFRRLNADGNPASGMGLGLTIVQRACELLGHPLDLVSEPGRGSRFTVTLGRADSPAGSAGPHAPAPPRVIGRQAVVLIIEDDAEVSAALALQLESWGFEALEVDSGAEAVALLRETGLSPDALIVDYHLQGGETGPDAVAAIEDALGPVPALVITAKGLDEVRAVCFARELEVLAKPIEERLLFQFLSRVC
ncbi:MAG: PAS-domain containing protein [Pseudomonadota bacterium]